MRPCEDRLLQLHALLDGELDAVNSIAAEAHLKTCVGCADAFARLEAVRIKVGDPALRYSAPASLRDRTEADIAAESPAAFVSALPRPRISTGPWLAGGAFTAMAASLALLVALPQLTSVRWLTSNERTWLATS